MMRLVSIKMQSGEPKSTDSLVDLEVKLRTNSFPHSQCPMEGHFVDRWDPGRICN